MSGGRVGEAGVRARVWAGVPWGQGRGGGGLWVTRGLWRRRGGRGVCDLRCDSSKLHRSISTWCPSLSAALARCMHRCREPSTSWLIRRQHSGCCEMSSSAKVDLPEPGIPTSTTRSCRPSRCSCCAGWRESASTGSASAPSAAAGGARRRIRSAPSVDWRSCCGPISLIRVLFI